MLSAEPSVNNVLTKSDLENQLKAFAKGELATAMKALQNQIKKDMQFQIMKLAGSEGELTKALSKAIETAMSQTAEKNMQTILATGTSEAQAGNASNFRSPIRRRAQKVKTLDPATFSKQDAVLRGKSVYLGKREGVDVPNTDAPATVAESQQRDMELLSTLEVPASDWPLINEPDEALLERTPCEQFVLSPLFEYGVAVVVIINAILIGVETQIQASQTITHSFILRLLDTIFCLVFSTELAIRLFVYREQACRNDYIFQSTSFDFLMVVLQILDLVVSACMFNVHVLSVLRVLRIARILRLLHLFDELSALIAGMTNAVSAMLWTVFLQVLFMYMFSIITMQILMTTGHLQNHDKLCNWFGTVDRAICTMFEVILGGVEWSEILNVLAYEVSPLMGFVMCTYIVISLFFLMNLVCGVFVERVTRTVREDKDELLAKRLSKALTFVDEDGTENEVTWEDFASKLGRDDAIRSYFSSIDVYPDATNARGLFELIDVDGSGQISGSEIVAGCLRLRGPAKAFEVALMGKEISSIGAQAAAGLAASTDLIKQVTRISTLVQKISDAVHEDEMPDLSSQDAKGFRARIAFQD